MLPWLNSSLLYERDAMPEVESNSKEESVQLVTHASAVTTLKIGICIGADGNPRRKPLIGGDL